MKIRSLIRTVLIMACTSCFSSTYYVDKTQPEVTGNGILQVYENTTLIITADLSDGLQNLKYSAVQSPCNLRFVYTPETGDTGGAVLDAFDLKSGLLIIIR
ncbi:MAG: hypothetical protein PF904_21605 [Kiritimatiellae bacterium]|jgi:hypothetical protein|nr:hypothetical protein [Kiritimatiellia bacterium]